MLSKKAFYTHVISICTAFLLCIYFCFALIFPKISNATFYLLSLVGLIALFIKPKDFFYCIASKKYAIVHVAMITAIFPILINQFSHATYRISEFESSLRFALFPLAIFALIQLPRAWLKNISWCFVITTFLGTLQMYILSNAGETRPAQHFMPFIAKSELLLLTGAFSVLSIRFTSEFTSIKQLFSLKFLPAFPAFMQLIFMKHGEHGQLFYCAPSLFISLYGIIIRKS